MDLKGKVVKMKQEGGSQFHSLKRVGLLPILRSSSSSFPLPILLRDRPSPEQGEPYCSPAQLGAPRPLAAQPREAKGTPAGADLRSRFRIGVVNAAGRFVARLIAAAASIAATFTATTNRPT
jgi:hypothetical protein